MSDRDDVVDVHGVTRTFPGPVHALAGVDLRVADGESVVITGPSGCGKSTLLHLLAAIDSPTTGSIRVAGHDVRTLPDPSRFRRFEVGLVFQFHNLLPQLTALANVELPMFGTGLSAPRRADRASELLAELELGHCEHRLPRELSGGERQRVAIARSLVNHPKILLADEPTGSLDSASTVRFLDLLDRLGRSGMTIVTVTHAKEVAERATRVVEMRDGIIVDEQVASAAPVRDSLGATR